MITPSSIGRYRVDAVIGEGGMGIVVRAFDPELAREVAVKLMLDTSSAFAERFRREAQALARLEHENIVKVFDFGIDATAHPFFVMECVRGVSLDKIAARNGALPEALVVYYALQAAAGLAAAHARGVIHRDLKPSNFMIQPDGRLKIIDFGIARFSSGAALTEAAELVGTPGYMAPEQALDKPVDHRADLYALGLTLFTLLAGQPPFSAPDKLAAIVKAIYDPLPDLRALRPDVSPALVALIEELAAKNPDARPADMDAILPRLREIAARLGPVPVVDLAGLDIGPAEPAEPETRQLETPRQAIAAEPERDVTPVLQKKRGRVAAVGTVIVVASATAVLFAIAGRAPTSPGVAAPSTLPVVTSAPAGEVRIAVFRFKNTTADPSLGMLETGIGETVSSTIGGTIPGVALYERNDLESDIAEIDRRGDPHFDTLTVAQKGQLKGVNWAVQGGVQASAGSVRVTARIVEVETGEIIGAVSETRGGDAFALQDAFTQKLILEIRRLTARAKQ